MLILLRMEELLAQQLAIGIRFAALADVELLDEGVWEAEMFLDGANSDLTGTDYRKEVRPVSSGESVTIRMASGGGFAMIIRSVGH